jgi:hypothetical protein
MLKSHGERAQLLEDYLSYVRAVCRESDAKADIRPLFMIEEMVERYPDEAWPFVLELVRGAEGDRMLALIGAGPLEALIIAHGDRLIDRIEALAPGDPKFRRALRGVWGQNDMSQDVVQRLEYLLRDEPPF